MISYVAPRPLRLPRAAIAMLALALALAGLASGAPSRAASDLVSVIVRSSDGADGAERAVERVGGSVQRRLSIISGVAAEVPGDELARLKAARGISQVTADGKIGFEGEGDDTGVTHRIQKIVRSDKLWNEGITGKEVTVALLDTGIYQHADLAGRVVACADLTAEAGGEAKCKDTFGHGTFMAGLIAGDGTASNGKYKGAAPGARLVSVKAAGYDGSTDVSTILAGIQWVVAHKADYGIRVLNLSLGSDSSQDYRLSPLNYAVERAWKAGIVVVVSAGNSGPDAATVMKPGDDPFVITVGASNDEGSMNIADDRVPVFSSRGPTRSNGLAKPDVVSPGVHTVSLRSPGSAIDDRYGSSATVATNYFRGTGTSMSTATVSGVVAQMLQANPQLTPDEVKFRLLATARPIAETDPTAVGRGLVDASEATKTLLKGVANVGIEQSNGLGLIEADRGTIAVEAQTAGGPVEVRGEFKAQLNGMNPSTFVVWDGMSWKTTGWDGMSWKDETWAGMSWKGMSWKATTWDGMSWKGMSWKNEDWDGMSWKGMSWKNIDWDGMSWKASNWQTAWYAAAWD